MIIIKSDIIFFVYLYNSIYSSFICELTLQQFTETKAVETMRRARGGIGGLENEPRALKETHFRGIRKLPWGRFAVEIRDPWKKDRVWPGTFDTAGDAARAYGEAARVLRSAKAKTIFALATDDASAMLAQTCNPRWIRTLHPQQQWPHDLKAAALASCLSVPTSESSKREQENSTFAWSLYGSEANSCSTKRSLSFRSSKDLPCKEKHETIFLI